MNVAIRPEHLDMLSICTGGGGLDLGIGLAVPGARSVCMVEREAFSVAHLVSAQRQGLIHPAPVWSDVRSFNGRRWRGCVDGLIGGIPCQPHSLAGRKQGSLDERDLWSPTRRIIVQSRCWFVLIENVAGMLSAGADEVAGAERVWRDLRKLGFAVEIGLFTAAEVGASHERERVFILAVNDELADACGARSQGGEWVGPSGERIGQAAPRPASELRGTHLVPGDSAPLDNAVSGRRSAWRDDHRCDVGHKPGAAGEHDMGNAVGSGHDGRSVDAIGCTVERAVAERPGGTPFLFPPGPDHLPRWADVLASAPELEPAFRRVADGLASRLDTARVDRLRMLGNGAVPLQAAHAFLTLCHRLAARGSAGAARLVLLMEAAE